MQFGLKLASFHRGLYIVFFDETRFCLCTLRRSKVIDEDGSYHLAPFIGLETVAFNWTVRLASFIAAVSLSQSLSLESNNNKLPVLLTYLFN